MDEPFFHLGILVKDIEQARADFAALIGVEFEPAQSRRVGTGEKLRVCYSLPGPPYLELMEMAGTGSYSPEQPEGLHHIGVSDASVPDRCAAFGGRVGLVNAAPDGSPQVVLTEPGALHGVRLEYFDASVAAPFLGYLRSRTLG
jgi:catechol 2,3-dioxygenase-like lactoylglutathione lyase family enzyme